jgi:hypothetical protein
VTLPITDAVVVQLARIADALEEANDRETKNVDEQVKDIRDTLERQYRDKITDLEKRLDDASPFPGIHTPIRRGGVGKAPVGDTDTL